MTSTETLFWISLIYITSCIIDCFEKVVTITKETMSRFVDW